MKRQQEIRKGHPLGWLFRFKMSLYYHDLKNDGAVTLHQEECLDTLSHMPNDSIDLVITSPPYNMNLRIRRKNGKGTLSFFSGNKYEDKSLKSLVVSMKVLMTICH